MTSESESRARLARPDLPDESDRVSARAILKRSALNGMSQTRHCSALRPAMNLSHPHVCGAARLGSARRRSNDLSLGPMVHGSNTDSVDF